MYKVTISKSCDCFKKSGLESNFKFNTQDKALAYALELENRMNNDFCSKHKFKVLKIFDDFIISTVDTKEKSLKCCGSGCCF